VSEDTPKPKRASLPKGAKPEELTLEDALGLLRLPRHLGEHPEGGKVQAGLGRFGPYVVHDKGKGEKDYRSLKAEDDVLSIGLSRALDLLAQPKRGRGGRTALRDLGTPEGASEAIQLFDGPYGLYVKQGKVNASLPEGTTAETITLDQAIELLAAKASSGKGAGRRRASAGSGSASEGKTAGAAKAAKAKAASSAGKSSRASSAGAPRKTPATTKSGRLRASPVRVIRPAGNG
jgi:DNA topoisomerase-1